MILLLDGHVAMPTPATFSRLYLVSGTKSRMVKKFTAVKMTAIHFCHRQLMFVTMKPQIKGPKLLPPEIAFLRFGQYLGLAYDKKYLHIDPHLSSPFMQKIQVLDIVLVSAFLTLVIGILSSLRTPGS
jgi:hypothetical protein